MKRTVLPALRARGFDGELPHLRRVTPDGTHTFSITTSKWGGRFIVELGRVPPGPYMARSGQIVAPDRITSIDVRFEDAGRLRAEPDVLEEVWFQYEPLPWPSVWARLKRLIGLTSDPAATGFESAARDVFDLLPECDKWWAGANALPHVRSHAEQRRAQYGDAPPMKG